MLENFLKQEIEWMWTMHKINSPFSVSYYEDGFQWGAKLFGYKTPMTALLYDNGAIYFDKQEIEYISRQLEYKIDGDFNYPDKMSRQLFELAGKIKNQKISVERLSNLHKTKQYFISKHNLFMKMMGFMSYRGSVQMADILADKVKNILIARLAAQDNIERFSETLSKISIPLYRSVVMEEKIDSLKLSLNFLLLSTPDQSKRMDDYFKKYAWIGYHWLLGKSQSREEIRQKFLRNEKEATKNLRSLKKEEIETDKNIKLLMKKLKLSATERKRISQYRSWIFLRTFVKDNLNLAGYKLLPILTKMAQMKGIEPSIMPYLTKDEILKIEKISNEDIKKLAKKRMNGFSSITAESTYSFERVEKYLKKELKVEVQDKTVSGRVAYQGVAEGIARIIMSPKDQGKLKEGDILITGMTTPDFLPIMEKAGAFVTDEGGITCHAAIVAREMKKPCVIGTRIGTKIFKDGDFIRVDAENGKVSLV